MQLFNRISQKTIISLAGLGLIVLAVIVLTPSPAPAQPVISWVPESLNETILVGETKTVSVSFTASEDITREVMVRVVPELEPFVRTEPTSFPNITAGQPINLDVIISAQADALPKTIEGTIQIRGAGRPPKNFARPLPVKVEIRASVEEQGLRLGYPQNWEVNEFLLTLDGPLSLNNFANAYAEGGIIPNGGAKIDITTIPLPSTPISDVIASDLHGTTIVGTSLQTVGGESGTRIIYTADFPPLLVEKSIAVYVPHNNTLYKFFLSYREGDPLENQFITDFQQILDSVRFAQ
jgi:hypothetical protein